MSTEKTKINEIVYPTHKVTLDLPLLSVLLEMV